MAANRIFARTPDPRVSRSPALHMSSICQFPGPPEIPPPAALTSAICNGLPLRLFSSFSVRRLPSFLFPLSSSSRVVRNLSPLCPLPNLPIPRPPHLPGTGAAEPAIFGGQRTRRKFLGGVSGTQKIPGEPSLILKNRGKWGPCRSVSASSTERVGT